MKNDFSIKTIKQLFKSNQKSVLIICMGTFIFWALYTTQKRGDFHDLDTAESWGVNTFSGVYFNLPQPVFVLDEGTYPEGLKSQALLVGNERFDVAEIIAAKEETPGEFNGKYMRISGTLFYGDEKMLIELTDGMNAIISVNKSLSYPVQQTQPKAVTLNGEILNPKCWFDSLKSGEGKSHKSCAIRCIEEGKPLILKVLKDGGNVYYLLESTTPENINTSLSDFVAEPVQIEGQVLYQNGWNVVRTNVSKIKYLN